MFGAKIINRKIEYLTDSEEKLAKEGYFTHEDKAVLTAFMEDELRAQKILFIDRHRGENPELEREIFGHDLSDEDDSFSVAFDGEKFWFYAGKKDDFVNRGLSVFSTAADAFSYATELRMNFYQDKLLSGYTFTKEQMPVISYYIRGTLDEIEKPPVENDNETEIIW